MAQPSPSIKAVFDRAVEIEAGAERQAYLDQACTQAPELRHKVEALLKAYGDAGSFLETPAAALQEVLSELNDQEPPARTAPEVGTEELPLDFLEPPEKPGQLGRLDHYEVLEVIGRGGMGVVLKAFDQNLHRVVAIKVLAPLLATSPTAPMRFIREAQAAAAVRNDHVIDIHAVAKDKPLPYLVMEYIAGLSLQDRLEEAWPLTLKEILRIGQQTAAGLAAAHAQGLIHRDIKPANILLENGVERVKITDFGLARARDDASLTQSGVIAGTPHYMAPEQAEGKPVDHRSDLFSLGSVLYAMCTGRPPFRASGTMAVLKRVCEQTPSPIRDTNPEIPDWLVAIIDKLHAKDPAQRYQSAAEVAARLGQHLAHVQHPSIAPLPVGVEVAGAAGASKSQPRPHRRRWAVAAAIILPLIAAISLTEATGVTKLTATVIRVLTPEGTLIVEVDDPNVKVTIEGDGGLVITGAGPQEVRLKPGSYKVRATKDGKLVRNELVTVSRGDKQVVRVSLEPAVVPPVAKAERQAFVILDGKGSVVRKYDTLAEAVQNASDGDTIEVRGNGPFVTEPITVNRALVIRPADGFRPIITLRHTGVSAILLWLKTAAMVLEGLDLQAEESRIGLVLGEAESALYVANCRFALKSHSNSCLFSQGPVCVVRNCEFANDLISYGSTIIAESRCVIDNCVHAGWTHLNYERGRGSVHLTRNTLGGFALHLLMNKLPPQDEVDGAIRVEASGNILGRAHPDPRFFTVAGPLQERPQPAQLEAFLRRFVHWRERGNLYRANIPLLALYWWDDPLGRPRLTRGQNLEDWDRFWGLADTGSLQGHIRFKGGDVQGKAASHPEQLTPDDFRLRPDSAGYRAGKDGKDLGAHIDLVGPGKAYERWKKTPEYEKWLKETGQRK